VVATPHVGHDSYGQRVIIYILIIYAEKCHDENCNHSQFLCVVNMEKSFIYALSIAYKLRYTYIPRYWLKRKSEILGMFLNKEIGLSQAPTIILTIIKASIEARQ